MERQAKPRSLQLRLGLELNDLMPTKLSPDKRRELTEALAELLISAASETPQPKGGENESQVNG